MAGTRSGIPSWAAIGAFILTPASGVAATGAIELLAGRDYHGKSLVVVPGLAPPLIAAYAVWAFFPAIRGAIPSVVMGGAVWGSLLILSILPWTLVHHYSRLRSEAAAAEGNGSVDHSKMEAERQAAELSEWTPKFEKLDPGAPLWEWLSSPATARNFGRRRSKGAPCETPAVRCRRDDWTGHWMAHDGPGEPRFGGYPIALRKSAPSVAPQCESIAPAVPDRPYSWEKALIDPYLPALEWLLNHGCDCMADVVTIESAVREYHWRWIGIRRWPRSPASARRTQDHAGRSRNSAISLPLEVLESKRNCGSCLNGWNLESAAIQLGLKICRSALAREQTYQRSGSMFLGITTWML